VRRGHPRSPRGPRAVVVIGAAVLAGALSGRGLLVPAGPVVPLARAGGGALALLGVGALLRRDGVIQGVRTLGLVSVIGAAVALATVPASPVSVGGRASELPSPSGAADGETTVVLDRAELPGGIGDAALSAPHGSVVRVEDGSIIAGHPDGSAVVLGPALPGTVVEATDGTVVVVGAGLLRVPPPMAVEGKPTAPDPLDDRLEAVLAVLLGAFVLLAFSPPLWRGSNRSSIAVDAVDDVRPTPPPPRSVEAGLADVLRSMLADPDPRTAVIGAYARLLVALDDAGMPRHRHEAPHEHLWRALGPLGVRRGPVHRLAALFVRARFTPQPVTDEHRRAAIQALADAVADLRVQAADVDALVGSPR
jgi:hypothetical protein